MQKVILTVGIPASAKSTWAREELKKNPNFIRVNMDDLRASIFNSIFSNENEKIIKKLRESIIIDALKSGRDIIDDNTNLNRSNFDNICKLVNSLNIPCTVMEKPFYIDLNEAILRNSKREGYACVPEDVIRNMWKKSGGTNHKFYKARIEVCGTNNITPIIKDLSLPKAVIFDNDGTISLIHSERSPYDASTCDLDLPHDHVIEVMKLYYNAGYKIIFVSGREEKDRSPTEKFYKIHFPEIKYELYMRNTGDKRKDVIIKEEIFNKYIDGKYNICAWFDDKLQVCEWVFKKGLPLFRVNDPNAIF